MSVTTWAEMGHDGAAHQPIMRGIHRFLLGHLFYPLLLGSALASLLFVGRVWLTRSPDYLFLGWNLLLAWIPYGMSLWAATIQRRAPRQPIHLLLPGTLWLLFFPNAPYLVTDLVHLRHRGGEFAWWYDVAMLFAFAWAGWLLGIASLRAMQGAVRQVAGGVAGWLFVLLTVGLGGIGIYLGRFLRWNSWDALTQPRAILADGLGPLLNPLAHRQPVGVIVIFAALLLVSYLAFAALPGSAPAPPKQAGE